MKEKRDRKKYMLAGAAFAVVLAAAGLVGVLLRGQTFGNQNPNLALQKGVKAVSDSVEQEALSADMAIDGNDEDRASRWSSENNREDASHYIRLEFPEEISVSFVVLKWERANVTSYALEGSMDGTVYETLAAFDMAPETLTQEIVLEQPANVRFLQLSTYEVSKESADFSDLYQNVSLYEFEVYGDKPTAYKLETPVIEKTAEGGRRLVMPEAPEGFRVELIGADLEQVIGADGTVYDNIQDKKVTVGYRVEDERGREEAREVSFVLEVPAADAAADSGQSAVDGHADAAAGRAAGGDTVAVEWEQDETLGVNACPVWVVPSIAEWRGGEGSFYLRKDSQIIVGTDTPLQGKASQSPAETEKDAGTTETVTAEIKALWNVAGLLAERCYKDSDFQTSLTFRLGTEEDVRPGDIYLGYAEEENGLGEEGYTCEITDKCVIKAESAVGVRWGTVTLMQMLFTKRNETEAAPQGRIRDYPLYKVRGFGIDVARKAVSIDVLYAMMEAMSWYKMNDLTIHLNDNEILATSGLTDSAERAMTAESAFRLESDALDISAGGAVSSPQDYAYTKEEFAQFIATAKHYGVTVVPEIDTPAHSLAITKRYPAYALRTRSDAVDQIDLGNEKAVALVEEIWREVLDEEQGAFREAGIVGIGMDEYYGDGEQYRKYLTRINDLAQTSGKTVRLWGSLSNMDGTTRPSPENLQMNIWSTQWADPMEMYEAGYSLINMQNNHLYIIPGGGYDYLDGRELYENWAPNRFYDYNRMETIPSYSPQMLGAVYMLWNDMCGNLDIGICEYDLYERFREPLGVLSVRLWGADRIGLEKMTLSAGTGEELTAYELLWMYMRNLEWERHDTVDKKPYRRFYSAGGNQTYLYGEAVAAEPHYKVKMKVWLEPDVSAEKQDNRETSGDGTGKNQDARQAQVIAAGDSAYGEWAFYAVEPETGKVGFSREGRTYTFDYTLPKGEWVTLTVEGFSGVTKLYVGGASFTNEEKEVDSLGSDEPFEEHATFVFPLQRVGKETGNFDGELRLYVNENGAGDFKSSPLR